MKKKAVLLHLITLSVSRKGYEFLQYKYVNLFVVYRLTYVMCHAKVQYG